MFDAQVVHTPKTSRRGQLLSKYVCARITSMTGIDIGLFDCDRHNTLYYFILNSDEQIYLRYGGRDARSPETYYDLDSFELALKLGLEQHARYQRGDLPRRERPAPFYPRDIPLLKTEVLAMGRCVECHLIADYQLQQRELDGTLNKLEDMFVSPDIKTIGIYLDIPRGLVVKEADGPAALAGLRPGDLITAIDGVTVLTFGDLQHAYNAVRRDAERITLSIQRNGTPRDLALDLPGEWWYTDLEYRYWSVDPRPYFTSRPLSDAEKQARNLPTDGLAAEVTEVDTAAQVYNLHQLKPGDIIYAVDGVEVDAFTQNLAIHIALNHVAGDAFTVTLIRDGQPMEMKVNTHREHFRKME